MKRILAVLFAWLTIALPQVLAQANGSVVKSSCGAPPTQIAHVAGVISASITGDTARSTAAMDVNAGNLIVCMVGYQTSNLGCSTWGPPTVTDTAGNTFTPIGTCMTASGAGGSTGYTAGQLYYAKNTTARTVAQNGTGDVITATFGGGRGWPMIACEQFSGVNTTAPLDATSVVAAYDVTSPLSSGSFSTAQADEVIVLGAYAYFQGAFSTGTIGGTTADMGVSGPNMGMDWRIVSSQAGQPWTADIAQASTANATVASAGFKK